MLSRGHWKALSFPWLIYYYDHIDALNLPVLNISLLVSSPTNSTRYPFFLIFFTQARPRLASFSVIILAGGFTVHVSVALAERAGLEPAGAFTRKQLAVALLSIRILSFSFIFWVNRTID